MNIDDRRPTTDLRAHSHILGKFQMAITLQGVKRSTSRFVLGWGFRGWRIQWRHFRLDQMQDGGRRPSWKFQTAISQRRVIRSTSCLVLGAVFGDGGFNAAISGWIKFKMAAGSDIGKLQMAICQQRIIRFTVCMYADHTLPSVSNL